MSLPFASRAGVRAACNIPIRLAGALVALTLLGALIPAAAQAHGLIGRVYLPIPAYLFGWAAAAVLVCSFVALALLWPRPWLERRPARRLCRIPRWLEGLCGVAGVVAFATVIYSGLAGSQSATTNLAPTAVFVLFWVGVPLVSALFGDVFRLVSPWLALARAARWLQRRLGAPGVGGALPYPAGLGRWPAVVGVLAFGWLELVFLGRDRPATLALLALAYAAIQLVGMALFGIERWSERGDAFAVLFGLFARVSPLEWRPGSIWLRAPLSGLTGWSSEHGSVALLCAMLGTTTFDGASNSDLWRGAGPKLARLLRDAGLGGGAPQELAGTVGLLATVGIVSALYWAAIKGVSTVDANHTLGELGLRFAHTLVPIAFGYLLAHYFSLLIFQGQATGYLISDPLGVGANLFGTANARIDYELISRAGIWYVEVGALIAGHLAGLTLAHDRALVIYPDATLAVRSQRWMLIVMVGFTSLGLWLLSVVSP